MNKKRPRTQTIEPEAERAICALLDPWATTKCTDYGRDLNVEVFTAPDEGSCPASTGILFDIQMKATDDEKPVRPKHVFRVKDLRYFQDNDLPVLLCLYYAQDRTIYSRWADTIRVEGCQRKQTIYFEEEAWGQSIKSMLCEDLEWMRTLRLHTALPCGIHIDDPHLAQTMEDYWMGTNILQATSVPHISNLRPTIRLKNNQVYIDFGVGSCSFQADKPNMPRDITTAVAIILLKEGYDAQAAALITKILADPSPLSSNMIWLLGTEDYHNLHTICRRMLLSDQIEMLCRLLRTIYISCPSVDDAYQVFSMIEPDDDGNPTFGDMGRYTESQIPVLRDITGDFSTMKMASIVEHVTHYITADRLSEIFDDWSHLSHSALCWLSESYFKLRDLERASEALACAQSVGDMGIDHPNIRRLRGMIAAAESRTDDAMRELDHANHLGDMRAPLLSLLVLIDHGRYEEAISYMTADTDSSHDTDTEDITGADSDEVHLLWYVLDHIMRVSGVQSQARDTLRAIGATHALGETRTRAQEQYDEYFKQAFGADIAWGSVWFNHAVMRQSTTPKDAEVDLEGLALDYLAAAVLCYTDAEAWICAIATLGMLARLATQSTTSFDTTAAPTELLLLQSTVRTALRVAGPSIMQKLHRLPIVGSEDSPTNIDLSLRHKSTPITSDAKHAIIEMLDIFVEKSPQGEGFLCMWPTISAQKFKDEG